MQKPSERHKFTSENNIIKFKKPVHDPFNLWVKQWAVRSQWFRKPCFAIITQITIHTIY